MFRAFGRELADSRMSSGSTRWTDPTGGEGECLFWAAQETPAAFYTETLESDSCVTPNLGHLLDQIAASDRRTLGGLTQFLTQFDVSGSATSL